jgi:Sulfotransferase family
MLISKIFKFVYIAIPRTGSKSMSRWLLEHYQGESFGDHHEWRVPEFAREYLIFTVVRNPYQRVVSGYFSLTWDNLEPQAELREQLPLPDKAANPLARILQEEITHRPSTPDPDFDMNQLPFVAKAGVKLALYFERLPAALTELPFADKTHVPASPMRWSGASVRRVTFLTSSALRMKRPSGTTRPLILPPLATNAFQPVSPPKRRMP